jgi:hypothetical protein
LVGPDQQSSCTCAAGHTCTTNNCYNGYWCNTATSHCVAAPTSCGVTTATTGSTGSTGTTGALPGAICAPCVNDSDCRSGLCNNFSGGSPFCDSANLCGAPSDCDGAYNCDGLGNCDCTSPVTTGGTTGSTGTSAGDICAQCLSDSQCDNGNGACVQESATATFGYCADACTASGGCASANAICGDVFGDGSQYCYPTAGCSQATTGSTGTTGTTGTTGANACDTCATAAESGQCAGTLQTCGANADCVGLNNCLGACASGDTACENSCVSQYPGGVADLQAAIDCVYNQACAGPCGAGTSTSGSTGTTGTTGTTSSSTGSTGTTGSTQCTDTYTNYAKAFFTSNCTGCHQHTSNLNSYGKVTDGATASYASADIVAAMQGGYMPQGASLSQAEIDRISAWYNCNHPQ